MISGIIGTQGSGKTMTACMFCIEHVRAGGKLITNIDINELVGNPNYTKIDSLKQLVEMDKVNTMIFIDEIILWGLDCRSSSQKENKQLTMELIFQCRKHRVKLFYSAQQFTIIDKRLRDQTDILFEVTKCIKGVDSRMIPIISNLEIDSSIECFIKVEMLHIAGNISRTFFFRANDYFNAYDTLQIQKTQYGVKEDKKK